jgi:hypothetical protein
MSNFIDLETVGCDDHHNRRIAELSGSLQLRDYPADVVRLSCAKCGRKDQPSTKNLIERYRADIHLLSEEIAPLHSALAWSRRVRNVSRSATRSSFCWISFSRVELLGSRRESCAIARALFEIDETQSVAAPVQ